MNAKAFVGNVYDEDGGPLVDGYVLLDGGGLRAALIGVVTPNSVRWGATTSLVARFQTP